MSVWITRRDQDLIDAEVRAADPALPLAGLRLAVKDNIDVAGLPTTAGCPSYRYEPTVSAPVVDRLVAAGAVVVGKTNLDQFATGLVGSRSPYGALESPVAPGHVSGGSSSGSAVAVATGAADIGLGTDTAGSGRVPAAFCAVVGLKPTPGWLSTRGVVPACPSFDCVSVFAGDVATAAAAIEAAAGFDAADPYSRPAGEPSGPVARVGVPALSVLEKWCAPEVVDAFASVDLEGFDVVEIELDAYLEAGELLYGGALVAERHASVGAFVEAHRDQVDPVVSAIIAAAGRLPAHLLARDLGRLAGLRRRAQAVWGTVDAVVVPTAPSHPTGAEVAADPVGANAALGRFTNGCNLLGWCAAAVPSGERADGLPFGVTVLGPAWADRAVWAAAAVIAGHEPPPPGPVAAGAAGVRVAVCGAHLQGQPLNHQLTERGARLVARTTTSAVYRLVCLSTVPPKPGLTRVGPGAGGAAVEVEVWELGVAGFGAFVADVPAPLVIGTVELVDGSAVKGFLCEPHAATGAEDITRYGGWRRWLASSR
ncbi:MAG: allophanate hydrolase [Acidimicrobiia bacterium]